MNFDEVEDACADGWVDVNIDHAALRAWAVRRRTALVDQLEE